MKNKVDPFEAIANAANKAPLQPRATSETRGKQIRAMPSRYFDAHAQLKADGATSLDFSGYIVEAVREKLQRDGGL